MKAMNNHSISTVNTIQGVKGWGLPVSTFLSSTRLQKWAVVVDIVQAK